MSKAVIQSGGKQYLVSKGDQIDVEKLPGEAGGEVVFDQVLLISGDTPQVGNPVVAGAKVLATILEQHKDAKVVTYKYKRRKGYHKKQGHRQLLTRVEIKDIRA